MKKTTRGLLAGLAVLFCTASHAQNNVLPFDGVNDRVIVPAHSNYDFAAGTTECWVRQGNLIDHDCSHQLWHGGSIANRWSDLNRRPWVHPSKRVIWSMVRQVRSLNRQVVP